MLETRNVSVFYGRHRALENVSPTVCKGEIVVMLGANGAGKSTFLRAVAGQTAQARRRQRADGWADITRRPPHEIVETGIALVPEDRGIFADLTVQENLFSAPIPSARGRSRRRIWSACSACFPSSSERRKQLVRTMSGGERQMVAIGRAMMSAPTILMLDEPSLGLAPLLCTELFRTLARIKEAGVGIFLVEQNARQSLAIADRGYLLDNGHIVGADTRPSVVEGRKGQSGISGRRARFLPPRRAAENSHSKICFAAVGGRLLAVASGVHSSSRRGFLQIDTARAAGPRKGIAREQIDPDDFIRCKANPAAQSSYFCCCIDSLKRLPRDGGIALSCWRCDASPFSWAVSGRRLAGRARERSASESQRSSASRTFCWLPNCSGP